MSEETIALFGSTGATGKHFLGLALEKGFKVQAMARDTSKVNPAEHDKLMVNEGDFANKEAIGKTLEGANYVVIMAGGPMGKPKSYPKDVMLNFFTTVVTTIQENKIDSVKVILYQAGGFSKLPDRPLSFGVKFMRFLFASPMMMGIEPNVRDNEAVIQYIYDKRDKDDKTLNGEQKIKTIISMPAQLEEKEDAASKGVTLVADMNDMPTSPITFYDLAVWSLKAIQDESLYGTCPYVKAEKK